MYGILNSNASIGITINIIDIEAIRITAFLKKIFSSSSTDITKMKSLRLINLSRDNLFSDLFALFELLQQNKKYVVNFFENS